MVITAVLFDLDGTLLDIDLDSFLSEYFGLLGPVLGRLVGGDGDHADALRAVLAGTHAMGLPHPGQSNSEVFGETFERLTGVDLESESAAAAIEAFYTDVFPALGEGRGPRNGSSQAVEAAREAGFKVVLATNPIFPLSAIRARAAWAGFGLNAFDLVTSYENAPACKPHPEYYRWIAEELEVDTESCLMVGDDAALDLAASDVGMKTFHIGDAAARADWTGDLYDVADLLRTIAARV